MKGICLVQCVMKCKRSVATEKKKRVRKKKEKRLVS